MLKIVIIWLSDRLTMWPCDWVTEWMSDRVTKWPIDWVTGWQEASQTIDRMVYLYNNVYHKFWKTSAMLYPRIYWLICSILIGLVAWWVDRIRYHEEISPISSQLHHTAAATLQGAGTINSGPWRNAAVLSQSSVRYHQYTLYTVTMSKKKSVGEKVSARKCCCLWYQWQ